MTTEIFGVMRRIFFVVQKIRPKNIASTGDGNAQIPRAARSSSRLPGKWQSAARRDIKCRWSNKSWRNATSSRETSRDDGCEKARARHHASVPAAKALHRCNDADETKRLPRQN